MADFNEIKEEIRQANDIVDVIGSRITLKKSGGDNYVGLCPFHNEKTPSFSVSRSKQIYHCFGCHKGGDVFKFIEEYDGLTFMETMEYLAERAGITIPKFNSNSESIQKSKLYSQVSEANKEAANYYYKQLGLSENKKAIEYIKKRKLNKQTVHDFAIGYAPSKRGELYNILKAKFDDSVLSQTGLFSHSETKGINEQFFNRIMFPITNERGKVVAFGGRVLDDSKPKYINSPETKIYNKRKTLYGLYQARRSKHKGLILCEGYMDVIALHSAGFDNAVASLGTALTNDQARLIKRYTDTLYLIYDSDTAGINAMLRAIPILRDENIYIKKVDLSPYKDPDEFINANGVDKFKERLDNAITDIEFMINNIRPNYNLVKPDEITKFQKEVIKILTTIKDNLERENYIKSICKKYNWKESAINLNVNTSTRNENINQKNKERVLRNNLNSIESKKLDNAARVIIKAAGESNSLKNKIKEIIEPKEFHKKIFADILELLYNNNVEVPNLINKLRDNFEDDNYDTEIGIIFEETNIDFENTNIASDQIRGAIIDVKQYNFAEEYSAQDLTPDMLLAKQNAKQLIDKLKDINILL